MLPQDVKNVKSIGPLLEAFINFKISSFLCLSCLAVCCSAILKASEMVRGSAFQFYPLGRGEGSYLGSALEALSFYHEHCSRRLPRTFADLTPSWRIG